ncbi:YEATS domain-containing protein 2 [Mactra antiquata]
MMSSKRSIIEIDPDYEDVSEAQKKRRRVIEEGAKQATRKKISSIIEKEFETEVSNKESELLGISERLELARNVMDRLRACIIANFYGKSTQQKSSKVSNDQPAMIHPTVRKFIGKAPPGTPVSCDSQNIKQEPSDDNSINKQNIGSERIGQQSSKSIVADSDQIETKLSNEQSNTRSGRFKMKKRVIVGNVSKSIPADQRDENDQATHKWMVYVRGTKDTPRIDDYVKKVWFFLHPSYRPNDLVEVSQPPFHLTRRGWGEFPVRVQLHFKDNRNKKVDIIHNLKLDRTYTGLQTLGCETVVDIEIEKHLPKVKHHDKTMTCTRDIKQEVDQTISYTDTTHVSGAITPVKIKTEPADDHGYGKASKESSISGLKCSSTYNVTSGSVTNIATTVTDSIVLTRTTTPVKCNVTLSQTHVQTVVSPNVISSQPLTFIPLATGLPNSGVQKQLCPVTPPKNNIVQLQAVSPIYHPQSPNRNVVLKTFGSTSVSNNKNSGLNNISVDSVPNNLIQVSPVKSQNSKSTNFIVPQPLILTNVSCNPVSVPQTGLQNVSPSQNVKMDKVVNQSSKSNLIFLKCTDNQGKTYLIPQQIGSCISSVPKESGTGTIRMTSPVTQPVLIGSNLNNKSGVRLAGPISPGQIIQKTVFKSTKQDGSPHNKAENGPILFIKPDNGFGKKVTQSPSFKPSNLTVNTLSPKVATNSVKQFSPAHNVSVLNLKTGKQTAVCASTPPVVRGQLKVTSQGLMQVQGQYQNQTLIGKQSQSVDHNRLVINGGVGGTVLLTPQQKPQQQQPVILFPTSTNNKMTTVVPGKGKSLLNSTHINLQVPQSNGNISVNYPSAAHLVNNVNDKVEAGKIILNGGTNYLTESLPARSNNIPPNHIVIVSAAPQMNMSRSVKGQSSGTTLPKQCNASKLTSSSSAKNSQTNVNDIKSCDKTMLIVLQNDKSKETGACTIKEGQGSGSSLLSRSNCPSANINMSSSIKETPVTITSSDKKEKQIIVINKDDPSLQNDNSIVFEKKIMLDPKRKRLGKAGEMKEKETIPSIRLKDYTDMLSLVRGVVRIHPIISSSVSRNLHPYCAKSIDEWLSWNVGKRRASEWQRASTVRKYILSYLDNTEMFNNDTVWSVKQIMTWCRLHAYNPHYLEKPLHPSAIDLQAETSLPSHKHSRKFTSLSDSNTVEQEVTSLLDVVMVTDSSDEEIDIISSVPTKSKEKRVVEDIQIPNDIEILPSIEGDVFVENIAREIGINLSHTEVEPGYYGNVSQGMIYKSMEVFMGDILRETFALKVNMGRYPDALGVGDVFRAIYNHPITDFLTNKHLGVENHGLPSST